MSSTEALKFENLIIENAPAEAESGERAAARASIEFLCGRAIEENEWMCVPLAVTEFSLADLIGYPRLLRRIGHRDGRIEFRYALSGPLCRHHEIASSCSASTHGRKNV